MGTVIVPSPTLCVNPLPHIFFQQSSFVTSCTVIILDTGQFFVSLVYLISCVLIMAQNSASASLCRKYLKTDVMITVEPLGGKQHPPRITGRKDFGQRKTPE